MTLRRRIQAALEAGDEREAIKLACTIPDHDLGGHGPAIRRAREGMTRPAFQTQLNRDPAALITAGLEALNQHLQETMTMAKNTKTKADKAPKTKAAKKAAGKAKEADQSPAAVSPAPDAEAAPAPILAPAAGHSDYKPLELTWDEINSLTSKGAGVWRRTIRGADIECVRDKKDGDNARGFTASISYSGRTTTARGKGFFAAVRAAIRSINAGK